MGFKKESITYRDLDLSRKSSYTNYIFDSYSKGKINHNIQKNNFDDTNQNLLPSEIGRN